MTVRPISGAISGEHVLVVAPKPAYPAVAAAWQKRLRMFSGRALDATALTAEQQGRAAKLALLGQTRSPGIANGFDVSLSTAGTAQSLVLTPGLGLMASGETVILGGPLKVPLAGVLPPAAAQVAILVATPVTTEIAGNFDPEDPCDVDESEEAYADEQLVDGFQLQFLPWDAAWGALPAGVTRNQFAYTVFELERALARGEIAPWQAKGVPLAALGIGASGVAWLDRHAVARRGGDAPYRTPLLHAADRRPGTPALWQARVLQLSDQIADQIAAAGSLGGASTFLAKLPPGGIVPASAVNVTSPPTYSNAFFPPTWKLKLAPLPLEQLDGVLQRVAQLAPLDVTIGEEVLVVVPVPQAVYDPRLLVVEVPDPAFAAAIAQFTAQRTADLNLRAWLQQTRYVLQKAVDVTVTAPVIPANSDPSTDPGALENEGPITPAQPSGEPSYGTTAGTCDALTALEKNLAADSFLTPDNQKVSPIGLATYISRMQTLVSKANDVIDFGFLQTQSDIYRLRQQMLGNDMATKLATSPALAQIAQGITATAVRSDLAALFTSLRASDQNTPSSSSAPAVRAAAAAAPIAMVKPSALLIEKASPTIVARREILMQPAAAQERLAIATNTTPPPATQLRLNATGLQIHEASSDLIARSVSGQTIHITNTGGVSTAQPIDISQASALIGSAEFRNVTVAERLQPPPAADARNYTIQNRVDTLNAMADLVNFTFPGTPNPATPSVVPPPVPFGMLLGNIVVYAVPDLTVSSPASGTGRPRKDVHFSDIAANPETIATDPPTNLSTEGDYFHDATVVLEAHISVLRQLEGVVYAYQQVLNQAQAALATVQGNLTSVNARMQQVQTDLTDKRSAVATTEALLAEETARVTRLNTTRKSVLQTQVPYLGYVRARFFEGLAAQPAINLDPQLLEAAAPACLAGHDDAPEEVAQMVGLLKEAPLSWLKLAPTLILPILNRVDLMQGLIVTARARAQQQANEGFTMPFIASPLTGTFGAAISAVGRAQVDAIWQPRAAIASYDLRTLVGLSWTESRDTASLVASLGDVIAGEHLQTAATVKAQAILTNIEKVAGCIWAQVGQVAPVIRLAWAQALDEYNAKSSLVTLTALPQWLSVPPLLRQSLEQLCEWLLTQIDTSIAAAVGFMHDLVRVCILLASHAPVDAIVSGSVPQPTPAGPGHLVPVKIDPSRIRIGMQVSFFAGNAAVAHGIVENLVGDQAQARIAKANAPDLRLDAGTAARFAFAGSAVLPLTRELG